LDTENAPLQGSSRDRGGGLRLNSYRAAQNRHARVAVSPLYGALMVAFVVTLNLRKFE
jgi:hypothetical protein